ncbi:MAG TPA: dockerin type I domain-containing protein [Pirellulales bacterium]|nr:dockerin type I domain-containing protein [Pirellulales bacterium]
MSRKPVLAAVLAVTAWSTSVPFVMAQNTPITSFTPGDLVVMRGGDTTHSQQDYSIGEVPAYLDEYTPAGTYVGTYAIPTSVMTLPGIGLNSHEGHLNVSGNGQDIDFAGYQQAVDPSTPRVTDGSGTGDYYQVGQVSLGGTFTHTALDTSQAFPQFIRAAYSVDGTQMWVASKYNGPTANGFGGGLEYIANFGTATAHTTALQGGTDWRTVQVVGGQLYGGTGSSSVGAHGFYAIGQGAPTTPLPANTLLSPIGNNSVTAFSFTTLPGSQPINGVAGTPNVVYVTGDPSGTAYLGKLYSPGGTPLGASNLTFASTANFSGLGTPEGLSVRIDPTNSSWVDIFLQTTTGVYSAIDKSGASNAGFGSLQFTQIVSSTSDTSFYGLALIPTAAQVLVGDVNLDGIVNSQDLALISSNWLASGANEEGDVNHDGIVNSQDLALVSSNWLATAPGGSGNAAAVPEPGTFVLAIMALLGWQFGRRRFVVTRPAAPGG